jgi:hypothetical protein
MRHAGVSINEGIRKAKELEDRGFIDILDNMVGLKSDNSTGLIYCNANSSLFWQDVCQVTEIFYVREYKTREYIQTRVQANPDAREMAQADKDRMSREKKTPIINGYNFHLRKHSLLGVMSYLKLGVKSGMNLSHIAEEIEIYTGEPISDWYLFLQSVLTQVERRERQSRQLLLLDINHPVLVRKLVPIYGHDYLEVLYSTKTITGRQKKLLIARQREYEGSRISNIAGLESGLIGVGSPQHSGPSLAA